MASVVFEAGGDARSTMSSALAAEGVALQPATTLDRTRLDTLDGRLFAAGVRAELRTTDGCTQELVVTSRDGSATHLPLPTGIDPTRPLKVDGLPPGALRARLEQLVGARSLAPQVRSRTRRRSGIAV